MDPQRRFLASILQGALDADVLSLQDLYRHVPAEVLAAYIDPMILWSCLSEALSGAGLGPGGTSSAPAVAAEERQPAPSPDPEVEVAAEDDGDEAPADAAEEEEEEGEVSEVTPEQVESAVSFDVTEGDVDDFLNAAASGSEEIHLDGDGVIEDLPPLPVDEALIVEEVNWGDDHGDE